jgi:quercetin dioxygenase-like cupin family protein
MITKRIPYLLAGLLVACSDGGEGPTAATRAHTGMDHMSNTTSQVSLQAAATPFTVRATIDPYQILQQPDFMMQSKQRSDIVMQQAVFAPGAGMWHTHPGPSFIYVLEGNIHLERVTKEGCSATPVYGPGDVYFEVGEQVHRAVVSSAIPAVVLVTRFNVPVGAPFTTPAPTPDC